MQFIRILLISVLMKQHATFIIPKESFEIPDEQISAIIYALSNASTILVSAKKAAFKFIKTNTGIIWN